MADEDGRTDRSAAWGVAAVVVGGGAIYVSQLAAAPKPPFPIWPTYVLGGIAALTLYLCFATIYGWWPTARSVNPPSAGTAQRPVADHYPDAADAAEASAKLARPRPAGLAGEVTSPIETDTPKVPTLPDQYVDRADNRQRIEALLAPQGARVAIYGLPGMGKTALAAKIAASAKDSLAVNKVLWANLGQEADAVAVLREWCHDLRAEISAVTGTPKEQLSYLRNRFKDAVSGKSVLCVLDDVGTSQSDLKAVSDCLVDASNSRYLLTAISARTASHFVANRHFRDFHVQEMPEPEAGLVLERYAEGRISMAALDEADRERLLRLGDGLPLGLMVLGRFLGNGLDDGEESAILMGKLDSAESLVQQELATRFPLGNDDEPASIITILTARLISLPPDQQEALQVAAVFREKPHAFEETAWAGVLAARRAAPDGPEEPEELAQAFGEILAKIDSPDHAGLLDPDDDTTQRAIQARDRLAALRKALMRTGLIEQPVRGYQSFTMHSLIAGFLRTTPGLDASELKTLHGLVARYYRGWLAGYQENQPAASPFQAAYRFENRQWLNAMLNLCYHLREAGNEDEAMLALTTLFFDAFWWWGELVPYQLCNELLRMWQLSHLGAKADDCLSQLRNFNKIYPAIDLKRVPADDPSALPDGYRDSTQAPIFQAVSEALEKIRELALNGTVDDAAAERDRKRLRMLTAIYLGEAYCIMSQFEQSDLSYQEALTLLAQFGQDGNDSDEWIIPYVYSQVADLHVRADDPVRALHACARGTVAMVGDDKVLEKIDGDIDHEALGRLWMAAGDAHWIAGRLSPAWRSYAWACFHACAMQLWPERDVLFKLPGEIPEWRMEWIPKRHKEFGVDDYTVTCYKLHLAKMLDRVEELWTAQRRAEASDGVRIIRQTLAGGPDSLTTDQDGKGYLDKLAAVSTETSWKYRRTQSWHDTGLSGLAPPLVPWERLTDTNGLADRESIDKQQQVTSHLAAKLTNIWASTKWTVGNGPGQQDPPFDTET